MAYDMAGVKAGRGADKRCVLSAKTLNLKYETSNDIVVKDVNFDIYEGERVVLLGPSGCGKSTILKAIGGYVKPLSGSIKLRGREIIGPGPDRAMVFQEFDQLLPWKTVLENVMFPLRVANLVGSLGEAREVSIEWLEKVKLGRALEEFPCRLSGGMKQRVAIARGLAMGAVVVLMDEPFASLDALTRGTLQEQLLELWSETQFTLVFVTHSIEEAVKIGSRIIVLSDHPGEIRQQFMVDEELSEGEKKGIAEKIRVLLTADSSH